MSVQEQVKPESVKEEAGPHFWYVMEKVIKKIPDNPRKSDIAKATRTMDHIAESFPCEECVDSYKQYKKEHPLKCSTRKECAHYLCEFHNNIRQKQGKDTRNCDQDEEEECPNCKAEAGAPTSEAPEPEENEPVRDTPSAQELGFVKSAGEVDLPSINSDSEVKLGVAVPHVVKSAAKINRVVNVQKALKPESRVHTGTSLNELKNVTRRIVADLCKQHGAPVPEIIFSPCPSNTKTSCTRVPVDLDGKMVKELPTKLYFDPHSYAPRSIIHEVSHYIAKWSGDDKLFRDEVAIDTIARQVIDSGFTEHEAIPRPPLPGGIPMPTEMTQVAHDMFSDGPNWLAQNFRERADKRLSEWKRNFPTFSRLFSGPATDAPPQVNTAPEPMVQAEPPPPKQTSYTDGFMTMIDPIFAPVANITGLTPRDVTDSHVPNLLGSVITTLAESNFNDFGSLLVSAGSAGLTLILGILAKDQLGMGDRRFIMGMGGNLLWNSLTYIANPKKQKEVFSHANMFGKAITTLDTQGMYYCMSYQGDQIKAGGKQIKMSPEQIRGLQIQQGFQPDVPIQNSYPIQGASTGGMGAPYGGRAVPAQSYSGGGGYAQADTMGARPYGNLDSEFDEFSLEEQNRISRAQRSAFSPAVA